MKQHILVIFSSLLATAVFAQSWSLTGNTGTNPPTNFLGTKDSKALVFKTNNTERMRINPTGNGNVGIGVTNPVQRLDVNGNINLGKGFSLFMENHRVLRVDSAYYNTFLGNGAGRITATGVANTATGYQTLFSATTGSDNSAYGAAALRYNTSGGSNTAVGSYSMMSNTTGTYNTAVGTTSLYYNTTGSYNVAVGKGTLGYNSIGSENVANGYYALYNNTAGYYNTAIGKEALYSNTTASKNTATGFRALFSNTNSENTAHGWEALYNNTTGYNNTATGVQALFLNTTGLYNVAFGDYALNMTIASWGNTAIGYRAGDAYNNGYYNTFIGSDAGALTNDIYNSVAIGNSAAVTAPNQVRLGNSYTNSIGGYTNWSNISDGRVKKNVKENVPGLAFINKLKPVTYNLDLDAADKIRQLPSQKDKDGKLTQQASQMTMNARAAKQQVVYSGFVAQDVEKAAKELSYDFSGVDAAKSDKDLYALRYSDFVVPLVKAVQDLSKISEGLRAENDEKDEAINNLKSEIKNLKSEMDELKSMIISGNSSATNMSAGQAGHKLQTVNLTSASLEQNMPNPFNRTTTINYTLPQQFSSGKIIITDKSGKALKEINVSGNGKGSLNVDASTLSSGAYHYSLYVNGKLINTKQMLLVK